MMLRARLLTEDAGMMKFRGFPRRTPCRRLWMNRTAHVDRSGSLSQLENALRSLPAYAYQLCVLPQSTGLSPGCQVSVKVWDKSCGWGRKSVSSSCWNMSSCCVHTRAVEEKHLVRTTHGHESKAQTKRIIHAGAAKNCCWNRRIL